jgi:hypothetical protein
MSFKTDELARLFPDVYAVDDAESLLYKLIDAVGAELMVADGKVKGLLKSHWVNYAEGAALDGLGETFGVQRRRLRDGTLESDDGFRLRLRSVVPLFTGGGTRNAVLGAVRSALGLPFDLDQLNLPAEFAALRDDIERLVTLEEFSPVTERLVDTSAAADDSSELILVVETPAIVEVRPQIRWTFSSGGGRQLSLELLDAGTGIKSEDQLVVPEGEALVLSYGSDGSLSAALGPDDVSELFVNLDGTAPAVLPEVPLDRSEWRFRVRSGLFDVGTFDGDDAYDLPEFEIEMVWVRHRPLTFDVRVPYFLQQSVAELTQRHGYEGSPFVFQGLPLERIQEVVDQTRAAGVRGDVYFSLDFFESHDQREDRFSTPAVHRVREDAASTDLFSVGSFNRNAEAHDVGEAFVIGGVWDVSTFDDQHGLQ